MSPKTEVTRSLIETPAPRRVIVVDNSITITGGVEVHIGDKFENINQSIVAARKGIAAGVVQIRAAGQAQVAGALQQLEGAIAAADDKELVADQKKQALELLNELTRQAGAQGTPAGANAIG